MAAVLAAVSSILCTCTATWIPRPSSGMDAADNTGKDPGSELAAAPAAGGGMAAPTPVSDHLLGPDAVAILATEHWRVRTSPRTAGGAGPLPGQQGEGL